MTATMTPVSGLAARPASIESSPPNVRSRTMGIETVVHATSAQMTKEESLRSGVLLDRVNTGDPSGIVAAPRRSANSAPSTVLVVTSAQRVSEQRASRTSWTSGPVSRV